MTSYVADIGTSAIRIGLAGEDAPREVLPPVYGYPKGPTANGAPPTIGFGGNLLRGAYASHDIGHLMKRGTIEDPEILADLLCRFTNGTPLDKTDLSGDNLCVLMNTVAAGPGGSRRAAKLMEIIFEKTNLQSLYIADQACTISLYGVGKMAGTIVSVGESGMSVVPVDEKFIMVHKAIQYTPLGGADVAAVAAQVLPTVEGAPPMPPGILSQYVERVSLTAPQRGADVASFGEEEFTLPDDSTIKVPAATRAIAPEVLWTPSSHPLTAGNEVSLSALLKAVQGCRDEVPEANAAIRSNILLQGGPTMSKGFTERFAATAGEIWRVPASIIDAPPERKYTPFIGGAIFSSMSHFGFFSVSREEFAEHGDKIYSKFTNVFNAREIYKAVWRQHNGVTQTPVQDAPAKSKK